MPHLAVRGAGAADLYPAYPPVTFWAGPSSPFFLLLPSVLLSSSSSPESSHRVPHFSWRCSGFGASSSSLFVASYGDSRYVIRFLPFPLFSLPSSSSAHNRRRSVRCFSRVSSSSRSSEVSRFVVIGFMCSRFCGSVFECRERGEDGFVGAEGMVS